MSTDSSHPQSTSEGVSVLVVSNRSLDELQGAIHSVMEQDFRGPIHVAVLGDNSTWSPDDISRLTSGHVFAEAFIIAGCKAFRDLPIVKRVSRLRNIALTFVKNRFVCFLDDDNRWEVGHLSSLVAKLKASRALAAHSWRQLYGRDGQPWLAHHFPWACHPERSAHLFKMFCDAGLMSIGSHIFRDSAELMVEETSIGAVDMGAWIFDRSIFDRLRFETDYSEWEVQNTVTEDYKLLAAMKREGLPIACSERATLRYSLGGYSNQIKEGLQSHV